MVAAYTYFSFRFRFLDPTGSPTHRRWYSGVVSNDGISLKEGMVYFEDIEDIRWESEYKMVILLLPYIACSALVTDNILPETYTVVLDTRQSELGSLKTTLNKYFTYAKTERKRRKLKRLGELDRFRTLPCPSCEAVLDLSGLEETKYIYCRYCETIFTDMGNTIPHMDDYRPCPECRYFGHVQEFRDVRFYFYGKENSAAYARTITCCDSCAQRLYDEAVWRNLGYLLAFPFSLYLRFHSEIGQHPDFKRLTDANRNAHEGKLKPALEDYDLILMQHKFHPGVLYNKARAQLLASESNENDKRPLRTEAARQFAFCLQACANYEPAIYLMQQFDEAEYFDFDIPRIEVDTSKRTFRDYE